MSCEKEKMCSEHTHLNQCENKFSKFSELNVCERSCAPNFTGTLQNREEKLANEREFTLLNNFTKSYETLCWVSLDACY